MVDVSWPSESLRACSSDVRKLGRNWRVMKAAKWIWLLAFWRYVTFIIISSARRFLYPIDVWAGLWRIVILWKEMTILPSFPALLNMLPWLWYCAVVMFYRLWCVTLFVWCGTVSQPVAGRLEAGLIGPAVSRPSTGGRTVTLNNVAQTWPVA